VTRFGIKIIYVNLIIFLNVLIFSSVQFSTSNRPCNSNAPALLGFLYCTDAET